MKCKSCGSDLLAGTKKCPYCGAMITIVRTRAEEVFDWSGFSTQAKKKKDVSIDWNTGKIFDKTSGQIYNQSNHTWSEPEAVKDLFKFDRKNEEYQQVLDRQVDSITETNAAAEAAASPAHTHNDVKNEFDLPSSMGMLKFDSLIKDADVQLISESGEEVGTIGRSEAEQTDKIKADRTSLSDRYEITEKNISTETGFNFNKPDLESDKKESPSPAQQKATTSENAKDTYTAEEEDRVFDGLKKLMAAEEKFKEDMERASYLTPEESAQAEKVEEKCSKLTFVPTMSFRSIEDEYAAYCDEHGIKHEKRKTGTIPSENKKATDASEIKIEKEPEAKPKKHSLRDSIKESLKNLEKNQDKAVEIKINEPSGTKVTVKTQEVSLAAIERELENAQTREVNMDEVVKPAKNLQVSVEVNAAQGNASVEVTRRHDGATVVKTVDKSHQGHVFVDDQNEAKTISDVITEEPEQEDPTEDSFWERSDSATKMTITDIFGPEARKILNQIDKNYSEEQKKADEDIENSLILDINPEDIAMTEDQTAALYNISMENDDDELDDDNDSDATAESEEAEAEAVEAGTEDEISEVQADMAENGSEEGTVEVDLDEADKNEVSIVPEEIQEEAAENTEAAGIVNEQSETEAVAEEIPENVVTETEKPKEPQEETSTEEVSALEKTRPIMKAEKAIMKEAARQKKRAEKAQKKLLKENKLNKGGKASKSKVSGKVLKLFTAILVIILVVEFSIIGIKLFASDSQAAVFIDRVEQYAVDIFKGGSSNSTKGSDSQQSQQDNSSAPEATPDDGAQQSDGGSGTAAPAEGNGAA